MHYLNHILTLAYRLSPHCLIAYIAVATLLLSCRGDEIVVPSEYELLPISVRMESSFAQNEPIGMYLLNE